MWLRMVINTLSREKSGGNFKLWFSEHILMLDIMRICIETVSRWIAQESTDDKIYDAGNGLLPSSCKPLPGPMF